MPNGHIVRSQPEASLCDYLSARSAAHEHWALNFELPTTSREWRLFTPSILLTGLQVDDRAVIIEPISSIQIGGGVRRLQSFRKKHSREYFVAVVTRRAFHRRVPKDAYDAIFPVEDFSDLGEFLRTQGKSTPASPDGP